MILGTLLKKWCIYRSELIWGSGKKLWSNIVKKCEITMGLPQEYWLGGSPRNLQNFVVIIFPKISATIDRIWYMMTRCTYTTINTSCQISHSSPYPTSCEKHLSHAMLRKFWIFHISGGAMPSMCTPNQNLSWYYDSWDTFEKMMYTLVRVDMRLRKEVMKAYRRKVQNNDVFIIYMMTSPRGPPPVGLWTMGGPRGLE